MKRPLPGEGLAQGRRIVLCVTGGIAAYKVVEVARGLAQLGAEVRVIMTPSARRFVGAQTFASVSNNPVVSDLFTDSPETPHVELARGADAAVVAPATANALMKMASGVADDLFSTTMLMARCPIVVAPAMHTEMWEHSATREHVRTLASRGVRVVGPASGALLSGDEGAGRMVEPEEIVAVVLEALGSSQDLAGRRLVVTAGGTQEPLDPVRFLGNRSSGLMGFAVAAEAQRRGAKVTLIAGSTSTEPPPGVEVVRVTTAEQMRDAVLQVAADADAIVKAAAVADFRPESSAPHKLKKAAGPPEVRLVATPDILAELGRSRDVRKPGGVLVGFAAETEPSPSGLARLAADKRAAKSADVMVANDVASSDSGFGARTNRAVIAGPEGVSDLGLVTKEALARALVDEIVKLLARGAEGG